MTSIDTTFLASRPRRNRKSAAIRDLIQETRLYPSDFVVPLFVLDGSGIRQPIQSMPGIDRLTSDLILKECADLLEMGIKAIDLFAVINPSLKNSQGSEAFNPNGVLCSTIKMLKKHLPELCVMVDIALDPFTDHGHDGLIGSNGTVDNDATLAALGEMSLIAAESGADIVAPSDMMDGRVGYIRKQLDANGFSQVGILAYTAKYASAFYGPFREALNSAPKFGDKKSYQMDPANYREALREAKLDEEEGADMLLVKPALPYLDVLAAIKQQTTLPVGAYHVSGEYAMVMAAAQHGWIDADRVFMESLLSIKRAGADFILSYAAKRIALQLQ